MKKLITLILTLTLVCQIGFAQGEQYDYGTDEAACKENWQLTNVYKQSRAWDDAIHFWAKTHAACPKYSPKLYALGIYLVKTRLYEVKDKKSDKYKGLTDTLIWMYEESFKHYGTTPNMQETFGIDVYYYKYSTEADKSFKNLQDAKDGLREKVSDAFFTPYIFLLRRAYKKKQLTIEDLLKEKDLILEFSKDRPEDVKKSIEDNLIKYIYPLLSCDQLEPAIQKKYDENPNDIENLKGLEKSLSGAKCTKSKLYFNITLKLLESEENPSPDSYFKLAKAALGQGNRAQAKTLIDKAISLAEDKAVKIGYQEWAVQNFGGKYIGELLKLDPKNGFALLAKADRIARSASSCGDNGFWIASNYWLAADYANKAKNADSRVASKANTQLAQYRNRFPTKEQGFSNSVVQGQSVKNPCTGETTTARFLR